ncbi:MAG: glycine cleavage T C-terminal barrel domain-containing protein [Dehalococcoidia bacterium]
MTGQQTALYHLALRETHETLGATFGRRDGWSLPEQYGDPAAEYRAIRSAAALIERSHRSRFMVTGTDAGEVLRAAFAGHVEELEEGRAMRSVALNDRGEISDIVLIVRTGGIAYLVTGEPGRRAATLAHMESKAAADFDVRIEDRTETTCLVGLVGPGADQAAQHHLAEGLPARLQMLHSATFQFHGFRAVATRTSDLGEDGFELMLAPAVAKHVIETLVAAAVPLAGSIAQTWARVEACIPAFAPDLETGLSPAEADIDVLLDIPGGRERWMLSAILVDGDAIPAAGTAVHIGTQRVGELRSAVHSPALGAVAGLAVIETGRAMPGTALDLDGIRATIVAKPLYRRRPSP